jgi:hypothetical protein
MEEQNTTQIAPAKPGKGLGIASLIIGIFGFILCFIPIINVFGVILAITALILGIVGMIVAKKKGGGIALPLVGLILGALGIIIFIAMYATMASM